MAQGSGSMQPLSVGNIVSAAFRLYKSHLQQYLGIALTATLWGFLPFGALILVIILMSVGNSGGLNVLLLVAWAVLLCYCAAQALMNTALISRLAFQELTEQPETVVSGRNQLRSKVWKFFVTQLLVTLLLSAVNFGLSLVQGIVLQVLSGALGSSNALFALLASILNLVTLGLYLWFYARVFIPEVPLALESGIGSSQAISRSWELSKGYSGRIWLVILVATLITIPVYIIALLPSIGMVGTMFTAAINPSGAQAELLFAFLRAFALTMVLLLVINIFVMPFWQSIKALLYYDLRSRREGLGLQFRDRKS